MHLGHRFVKLYVPRVDDLLYILYPFLWLSSFIPFPIIIIIIILLLLYNYLYSAVCRASEQCITFTGSRSLLILETCPNHVSLGYRTSMLHKTVIDGITCASSYCMRGAGKTV